jgi:hypothetical protein
LVPTGKSPEVGVAIVAGNTLLKFFFGEMLNQLREDGCVQSSPVIVSSHRQAERGQIQPVSIQIVLASNMRYRAYLQRVRPVPENLAGQ